MIYRHKKPEGSLLEPSGKLILILYYIRNIESTKTTNGKSNQSYDFTGMVSVATVTFPGPLPVLLPLVSPPG